MKGATLGPRIALAALHLAGVVVATWLLLSPGLPGGRQVALLVCAWVYFVRFLLTTFHLLERRVEWSEAWVVGAWVLSLHVVLASLGARSRVPWGGADTVAAGLYLVGSFLNTASEWQRRAWKHQPGHAGHLYTGGLFGLSMHVNYFGDSVLFTGYALLTHRAWALLVPAVMTAGFVFGHIPRLDGHLRERYGEEFREWERRARRFVPFLY